MKIVKYLTLINVVVFIISIYCWTQNINFIDNFALYPGYEFRYYQLLTHIFLHSDEIHLISNLIFLIYFGNMVEKSIGSKKFLFLYLLSAIGAATLQLMIESGSTPMVGASGAIYGLISFSVLINPNPKIKLIFTEISIRWISIYLILSEFYSVVYNPYFLVAHWAHIGGAFTGLIFYSFLKRIE
jgi:membrane associated rhomboid family serine protease